MVYPYSSWDPSTSWDKAEDRREEEVSRARGVFMAAVPAVDSGISVCFPFLALP